MKKSTDYALVVRESKLVTSKGSAKEMQKLAKGSNGIFVVYATTKPIGCYVG